MRSFFVGIGHRRPLRFMKIVAESSPLPVGGGHRRRAVGVDGGRPVFYANSREIITADL